MIPSGNPLPRIFTYPYSTYPKIDAIVPHCVIVIWHMYDNIRNRRLTENVYPIFAYTKIGDIDVKASASFRCNTTAKIGNGNVVYGRWCHGKLTITTSDDEYNVVAATILLPPPPKYTLSLSDVSVREDIRMVSQISFPGSYQTMGGGELRIDDYHITLVKPMTIGDAITHVEHYLLQRLDIKDFDEGLTDDPLVRRDYYIGSYANRGLLIDMLMEREYGNDYVISVRVDAASGILSMRGGKKSDKSVAPPEWVHVPDAWLVYT